MCLQTEGYFADCCHRFPASFSHCDAIIEKRKSKGLWIFSSILSDPFKPCDNHQIETKENEGLCPTCDWGIREKGRMAEMRRKGIKEVRGGGLQRTDE